MTRAGPDSTLADITIMDLVTCSSRPSHKAPGPDNIQVEQLHYGGLSILLTHLLTTVSSDIYTCVLVGITCIHVLIQRIRNFCRLADFNLVDRETAISVWAGPGIAVAASI